ncbi:uncharacterized protein FFB20_12809 [Fusarium fujikuroi]|nr:uncharacterized protein FPRN_01527 [Fusarium proliferatum]SCN66706.1 uncharacterized protein FFE2_00611 [Fusarium fujikuroi]SCN69615.1 uncharacterized protein FFC1_00608 [Fusarium fujikuroi]SCN73066.1 uncharacterized protein FFM5_00571 [Fusarium fujikuroi]SCO07280.1 uncharacterized protein FFB20_12809 [Fusarium fujikuroi]
MSGSSDTTLSIHAGEYSAFLGSFLRTLA